ncbi:hypothetical protein PC128_g19630 [Phytophthora cactorum]|nr:hypothetical protein PC128_g19630 [Phytophthora cactorum]
MVKPTTDASSEVEVSEKTGQPILWNGQNWEYYKKLMELMVRKKNVVLYKIMKGDTVFDETWDDAKKNYNCPNADDGGVASSGATSSSGGFAGGGGGARVQTHFTPASGFAESDDIRTEQQNDDRIGRTEETTDGTGAAASGIPTWTEKPKYQPKVWVLDSGANRHLVDDRRYFVCYRKLSAAESEKATVHGHSGKSTPLCVGSIDLWVIVNGGHVALRLDNVYYSPKNTNLLSQSVVMTSSGQRGGTQGTSEGEDVDMPEVALTSPSSTREPWHSNPLPTFSDDIVLPPEQPRAAAPGNGGDAEPGKDRAGEPTTIHENDGKAAEEMTRWLYLYGGQPKLMEKNRR